jgi:outer membrane protein assembly factor BamB
VRRLLIGIVALVVLAGAAAGVLWYFHQRTPSHNKFGSSTKEFVTTAAPAKKRSRVSIATKPWPIYGYDVGRTHDAPQFHVRPPLKRIWTVRLGNIIEFPPVVGYGLLFVNQLKGRFFAIDAATGRTVWRKHFLHCGAASPAVGSGIVYQAYMQPYPCNRYPRTQRGFVVAMRFRNRRGEWMNGRILWSYRTGAVETSPLLVGGTLYFGTWDGRLYALDVRRPKRPRLRWKFVADSEIDSSPAYANGRIFFGTNGGSLYALNSQTGHVLWHSHSYSSFLHGREYFYAAPTLAYGRVYIGNTDGTLYAFGQRTGHLLWARHAGTYVYAAAAVWRREVIVGTYDGHLIAYNAATGRTLWDRTEPAAIHGAPAVVDGVVYFSTCRGCGSHGSRYAKYGPRGTYAVSARNGRRIWSWFDGQYSPVVADSERIYIAGHARIYGLVSASKWRAYLVKVLHKRPRRR